MILLLSNKWDLTVDFVVAELRRRSHPFLRMNSEDLVNERATVFLPDFRIEVSKCSVLHSLGGEIRAIWNRRPGKPFDETPFADRPSAAVQRFASDQWYSWLESLQLLPDVGWVNHPHANDAMESKIRQLHLAQSEGFVIPETVITNDPDEVRSLLERSSRRIVAKALYSPLIEEPDQDYFVFTQMLNDLPRQVEEIRLAPLVVQRALSPKVDYRVTVVGDTAFPVRITLGSSAADQIDWRTVKEDIDFTSCELPRSLVDRCIAYVSKAGLAFGAIDLVEHSGEFYFLEINPNGEWGWLQKPHNIPIAETLCDLLVQLDGG